MGKTTQTVQETKGPASFAAPYINDIVAQAQNLYRSGAGSAVWGGPNVAPLDPILAEGLSATANQARRNAAPIGGGYGAPFPSAGGTSGGYDRPLGAPDERAPDIGNLDMTATSGEQGERFGGGGAGLAELPYRFALRNMGANGITPEMRQPLGVLGDISRGAGDIDAGVYRGLLDRALTANRGANRVMGELARRSPITTADAYGDVAARVRDLNSDVIGNAGAIAGGAGDISVSPQLAGLFDTSQTQNARSRDVLGRVASGADAITAGNRYRAVADSAALPTVSAEYLTDLARGGGVNPFLQKMLDDQAARVANRVNSSMSGAGRYGSAGHADALARAIAEAGNPVLAQAYESDQNRRLSAAGQIDAARRAADATRFNAIAGETGAESQNIANRVAAARDLMAARNADTALGANLLGQIGGFENQNIANRLAASGLAGNLRNANVGNELAALGGQTGAQAQGAGLRLNAATGLAGSNRADLANALGAAGGLANVQGQNIANRTGAANSALAALGGGANRAVNWAGLSPALNSLMYDPASRLTGVGSLLQNRAQAELDAQKALFGEANAMPWTQLGRYAGLINPTVQPFSSTSKTTEQSIPWTQAVGLGLNGLSLFGAPKGGTSPMEGFGKAVSSALPFLPSLLPFFSDRSEKTDVKKIGRDANTDLDIYAYRYKGDPKTYPKVVGPMAQDVAKKFPRATGRVGDALYVNPSSLLAQAEESDSISAEPVVGEQATTDNDDSHVASAGYRLQRKPDYLMDMGISGLVGAVKGAASVAGITGDLRKGSEALASYGLGWLAKKLGVDPEQAKRDFRDAIALGPRHLPTSENIVKGVERWGELPKPQTPLGRYSETVASMLPGAVGPGGPVRNIVNFALLPGIASEAAGEATKDTNLEPWARMGAAVASGGAMGLLNPPKPLGHVLSRAVEGATPAQLDKAEALFQSARAEELPITRPEAVQQVTNGATRLGDVQRLAEDHGRMRGFFAERPAHVDAAARRMFETVVPTTSETSRIGPAIGKAAEEIVRDVEQAIATKAEPYFTRALNEKIDPFTFKRVKEDPVFIEALRRVREDPWTGPALREAGDDSVAVIHAVKELLDETGTKLRDPLNRERNRFAASVVENGRDRIVSAADRSTGSHPEKGPGTYETARDVYEEMRKRHLEPLLQGPLGKIVGKDTDLQKAMEVLFPRNPLPNSAQEIHDAVSRLSRRNPWAAQQLVRAHLESTFNEAMRTLPTGPNQWGGAEFAAALRGNPQQAANIKEAITALPKGLQTYAGIDRFLHFLEAQGRRQHPGPQTPFNIEIADQFRRGNPISNAMTQAMPQSIRHAIEDWRLGRGIDQLPRLFTDPAAGREFRKLAAMPVGSRQALLVAARLGFLAKKGNENAD